MKKKYLFAEAKFILLHSVDVITGSEIIFVGADDENNDDTIKDPFAL